jgi:hypothetical protein
MLKLNEFSNKHQPFGEFLLVKIIIREISLIPHLTHENDFSFI